MSRNPSFVLGKELNTFFITENLLQAKFKSTLVKYLDPSSKIY